VSSSLSVRHPQLAALITWAERSVVQTAICYTNQAMINFSSRYRTTSDVWDSADDRSDKSAEPGFFCQGFTFELVYPLVVGDLPEHVCE
jgi:hypothetical protein